MCIRDRFLDLATARQLDSTSTGHAARSTTGNPSPAPSNLYMKAGTMTPEMLMSDIKTGLYVTELMGMSVNMVTGDYSRGAGGFWIENGVCTHPVSDVTVAGNLKDMFKNLEPYTAAISGFLNFSITLFKYGWRPRRTCF